MVKSLYTLRLSSGYNDLLNSENLKVDIGKLCHDIEVCNFTLSVDSRNFKKWGRSPTTTQNVGEGLKILGDDFMISLN